MAGGLRERLLLHSVLMSAKPGLRVSVALFGEALMDELPSGPVPGGAPLNVARHLRAFGLEPLLITRVGTDELGDRLIAALERWGLDTRGVQRDLVRPTGRVSVRVALGHHRFEIPPDQAWDFIDATAAAGALGASPDILYFGTLAQRHHESRRALWGLLSGTSGARVFDVNLRKPWYGVETIESSLASADVLKLNESELAVLGGAFGLPKGVAARADALMRRFSIREVVITHGAKGARVFETGGETRVSGAPLASRLVDTVGAGDGFAAILILGASRGWPLPLSLARADRFARSICLIPGAVPEDERFYEPYVEEWGRRGGDDPEREELVHRPAQRPWARPGA